MSSKEEAPNHHVGGRIAVIGSGGKTTLAGELARRLQISHVELDALHWEPDWTEAELDVFKERVTRAISGDAWVVDGNYSKVRDVVWPSVDTIVWLDYPLRLVLWRTLKRTLRRIVSREPLWGSRNRETLRNAFFSRDSLFMWHLQTHARRRRNYEALLSDWSHLRIIHLRSHAETRSWLESLSGGTGHVRGDHCCS